MTSLVKEKKIQKPLPIYDEGDGAIVMMEEKRISLSIVSNVRKL